MTYKNDCVQDNQGENGNKLKQLLHVNMKAEILNIALQHVSYQNENRLSSEQLEKRKSKINVRIFITKFIVSCSFFTEFSNDYTRHK